MSISLVCSPIRRSGPLNLLHLLGSFCQKLSKTVNRANHHLSIACFLRLLSKLTSSCLYQERPWVRSAKSRPTGIGAEVRYHLQKRTKGDDTSVVRFAQRPLALRQGPPLVTADLFDRLQGGLKLIAVKILKVAHRKKYIVPGGPDPAQVEMTSGDGARLLGPLEVIAAISQNCGQALDPGCCFRIIFNGRCKTMPASVVS